MEKTIRIYDEEAIRKRVAELGGELTDFYAGKPVTAVTLMNGAMFFAADLLRKMNIQELWVDAFCASSYRNDASSGSLSVRAHQKLPVAGRHILLLDDILDTGFSMMKVRGYFESQNPLSVRSCVFLEKDLEQPKPVKADWVGFHVPDLYVIGYGLDSHERYRNLPELYQIVKGE